MTFRIQVPGSTANLGPGFDSIGVALPFYLTVEASLSTKWQVGHIGPNLPPVSEVLDHLLIKTAIATAHHFGKDMPACQLLLSSDIPLTRGLGSSAAAIVAAIYLANEMAELHLSVQQMINWASELEGHPDNVAASILGGCVITTVVAKEVLIVPVDASPLHWLVAIPHEELKTEAAREVLPSSYSRQQAVQASSVANVLVAALHSTDKEKIGSLMELDSFHEPYRLGLINHASRYRQAAKQAGVYGTAISGAGPTLISLVDSGFDYEELASAFPSLTFHVVPSCIEGVRCLHAVPPSI